MLSRLDRIMALAFPVIVVLVCVAYYFVEPSSREHLLQCPWRLLTGTLCPACGSQRALHALMHGHVSQALSYNYFFILSIPYALLAVLVSWYNYGHRFDSLKRIVFHPHVLKAYVILFLGWWIVRNLIHL